MSILRGVGSIGKEAQSLGQKSIEYTEQRNLKSKRIDNMRSLDIARLINEEDHRVPRAISNEIRRIARIVDQVGESLQANGRVIYVGAGTSGRLGILDATEIPPTYGVPATRFQGIIAGGARAVRRSIEGAEDNEESAQKELRRIGLSRKDVLIGLSASGRTPFVLAAMRMAKKIGAKCFGITCNPNHKMGQFAQDTVVLVVGPEVVAGSSRMKCGSAQKMVLNIISTTSMIRLGRVWQGLMIGLQPKSKKLQRRAIGIVSEIAGVDNGVAKKALVRAKGNVRVAILSLRLGISIEKAKSLRITGMTRSFSSARRARACRIGGL